MSKHATTQADGALAFQHAAGDPRPGIPRRLASMAYELMLVLAVLWAAAYPFVALTDYPHASHLRPVYRLFLAGVMLAYFLGFWLQGGQTLAMKTWNLRLVAADGRRLTATRALLRFVLATLGLAFCGVTILWAFLDHDRQFLHDRLAGTRLILAR